MLNKTDSKSLTCWTRRKRQTNFQVTYPHLPHGFFHPSCLGLPSCYAPKCVTGVAPFAKTQSDPVTVWFLLSQEAGPEVSVSLLLTGLVPHSKLYPRLCRWSLNSADTWDFLTDGPRVGSSLPAQVHQPGQLPLWSQGFSTQHRGFYLLPTGFDTHTRSELSFIEIFRSKSTLSTPVFKKPIALLVHFLLLILEHKGTWEGPGVWPLLCPWAG